MISQFNVQCPMEDLKIFNIGQTNGWHIFAYRGETSVEITFDKSRKKA